MIIDDLHVTILGNAVFLDNDPCYIFPNELKYFEPRLKELAYTFISRPNHPEANRFNKLGLATSDGQYYGEGTLTDKGKKLMEELKKHFT